MRLRLTQGELERLLPAQPELVSHCHRVSALTQEIAAALNVHSRFLITLDQAALLHHSPGLWLDGAALDRLLIDIYPSASPDALLRKGKGRPDLPEELAAVLRGFHGVAPVPAKPQWQSLADVLVVSNLLDEQRELALWDPLDPPDMWRDFEDLRGLIQPPVLEAARKALDAPFRVAADHPWDLPVQASVGKEVLCALAAKRDCDLPFLANLAIKDPVLSGKLVEAANSALYSRRSPVRSIPQAISYIGSESARKVLLALAIQRLVGSAKLTDLWRHSVWMAQYCEALAGDTGLIPPDDALLLGLVHDIGRIALATLPSRAGVAQARLVERGCPPAYAERFFVGRDHAEIGAEVLRRWHFPDSLVEAVRMHHRPADSDSVAASVLYLAEFHSTTDEDLPSRRHFNAALQRTGLDLEALARVQHLDRSLARALKVA